MGRMERSPIIRRKSIVASVQMAVCEHFGMGLDDLTGHARDRRTVWARFIAIDLLRAKTPLGLVDLGYHFGGRDHTTIMAALRRASELYANDSDFRRHRDTVATMTAHLGPAEYVRRELLRGQFRSRRAGGAVQRGGLDVEGPPEADTVEMPQFSTCAGTGAAAARVSLPTAPWEGE